MGTIRRELEFKGNKGELTINTLFDTGSTLSLIKSEFAEKIEVILDYGKTLKASGIGKNKVNINNYSPLKFMVNGFELSDFFYILDDMPVDAIVGAQTMQKWGIILDLEGDEIRFKHPPDEILLL